MGFEELAKACRAMGDPTRAHILQFLLGCCCPVAVDEEGGVTRLEDITAGTVCCHLTGGEKVTSTVSFHLKELRQAGLVEVERRGKYMVIKANRSRLTELADFFASAASSATCCSQEGALR